LQIFRDLFYESKICSNWKLSFHYLQGCW